LAVPHRRKLNVGELRYRAQAVGVDKARVEEARDEDDPKAPCPKPVWLGGGRN